MRKVSQNKHVSPQIANMGYYDVPLPIDKPCAIYARQSTTKQVVENLESSAMQTVELIKRVLSYGWNEDGYILYVEGNGIKGVSGTKRIDQREGLSALMERIYADEVKVVFVYDVSRLFRDEFQIQVNTYIKACYDHDVLTITPSYRYDFRRHSYDIEQFRREAEQAANFIKNHLKKTVLPAKDRVNLDGRYSGAYISAGYIVDRSDKQNKRYQVYEPHARVVRWIFKRFRELDGKLFELGRELEAMPYVFPPFDSSVSFHKIGLKPRNGGYGLGRSGLANLKYLGWWTVGELDEDGHRAKNPMQIVSRDNHPAIVDAADFWYAFNLLSPTDIDGMPIEREGKRVRYTQEGKAPSTALLTDVIEGVNGQAVYVYNNNSIDRDADYVAFSEQHTEWDFKASTAMRVSVLDGVFIGRMMHWLRLYQNMGTVRYTDIPAEIQQQIFPMASNNLYTQFDTERVKQPSRLSSIEQQITETHTAIKRAERDKQIASDEDYDQGIQEAIRVLKLLNSTLAELVKVQASEASSENEEERALQGIAEVLRDWQGMKLERQLQYIRLVVDKVIIEAVAPRWVRIEIRWKTPMNLVDVCYMRREGTASLSWSEDENTLLATMYPRARMQDIVAALPNRSWRGINARARREGVHRCVRQADYDSTYEYQSVNDVAVMDEQGIPEDDLTHWLSEASLKYAYSS